MVLFVHPRHSVMIDLSSLIDCVEMLQINALRTQCLALIQDKQVNLFRNIYQVKVLSINCREEGGVLEELNSYLLFDVVTKELLVEFLTTIIFFCLFPAFI